MLVLVLVPENDPLKLLADKTPVAAILVGVIAPRVNVKLGVVVGVVTVPAIPCALVKLNPTTDPPPPPPPAAQDNPVGVELSAVNTNPFNPTGNLVSVVE